MKPYHILLITSLTGLFVACGNGKKQSDAYGNFEANEVIVSAESTGKLLELQVAEGATLEKGKQIGLIDAGNLELQKLQAEASLNAIDQKLNDASPQVKVLQNQIAVQKQQLAVLEKERNRSEKLVQSEAAPSKQLDDIDGQISVLKKQIDLSTEQIEAQKSQVSIQNRGILSEKEPLRKKIDILSDQISKSKVFNPVSGTVLTKYAEAGEVVNYGKPLYKIADLSNITLRAYISGEQLPQVKIGQSVKVLIDAPGGKYTEYTGNLFWISDKAEFTPKIIQTKDERVNLVYAVKINVKNDGSIKIGMPGEVRL